MNIGLVVHYFDRSEGTGGYVVELARRFAQEHDVTVYAAGVRTPPPENVRVVTVPAVRGRAYATILTFPAAFAAVRRRHDIVHAQGWVAGRADVVTAHIVLGAWRERAAAAGIRSAAGERWLGGFVTAREAACVRRARAVIAPSAQVRTDLARLYRREGSIVVPHGFSPSAQTLEKPAARQLLRLPGDRFHALYVGDARKGLLPAMEALAAVPAALLVVLSGTSPGPFLAHAARIGIRERVHWLGHLRDPAPAYAAADVLIHPTIYDTFGLVVAEAMSHGLPVIVTRSAGISELIRDGVSGLVVENGNAAQAGTALATLLRDPSLCRRLGEGARSVAAQRPWERVAQETLAVYEQVRR